MDTAPLRLPHRTAHRAAAVLVALVLVGCSARQDRPVAVTPPGAVDTAVAPAGTLGLVLNIPAYRLDVFRDGEPVRSYRVAVGAARYPTPPGEYTVAEIIWNPWWVPPASEWAAGREPVPPGAANPMGRVKMKFKDLYYIHGTAEEASLGKAASHGCVRLSNPNAADLARLVQRFGADSPPPAPVDSVATDTVRLERPVPFTAVYRVAEVHGPWLEVHTDVYGWMDAASLRDAVLEAVAGAGYDVAAVDRRRLDDVVDRSRNGTVRVRVETLLSVAS